MVCKSHKPIFYPQHCNNNVMDKILVVQQCTTKSFKKQGNFERDVTNTPQKSCKRAIYHCAV